MAIDPKKIAEWGALAAACACRGRVSGPGVMHGTWCGTPDGPERHHAPPPPSWHTSDRAERLGVAVDALLAERDEMLALLREIEVADNSDGEYTERCPACRGRVISFFPAPDSLVQHRVKHAPDCRLAAILK